MTMSTRLAVMDNGWIVQTGTPAEVYEYPRSRLVADFIGSINLFEGVIAEQAADHVIVRCDDIEAEFYISAAAPAPAGARVSVAVRPEKMHIAKEPPADPGRNCVRGTVEEIAYLGSISTYHVRITPNQVVRVTVPNFYRATELPITWEDTVHVTWQPHGGVVLTE